MVDDILALLTTLQDEVEAQLRSEGAALLDRTRELSDARARRLGATRERLAKELGEDHPRVRALTDRHAHLVATAEELADVADRQRDPTRPGKTQWRLHGRVTDRAGRPVADAHVQLVRRGGDKQVGPPATVDKRGRYSLIVDLREAPDTLEVSVRVTDRRGAPLLRSDHSLQPGAGRTDIADIVVRSAKVDRAATSAQCEATTVRGSRCRNAARQGSRFCATHGGK